MLKFFESLESWLKSHFSKMPAIAVKVSSVVNYVVPFIEELDVLVDPAVAPLVNPILDKLKVGLGALATTISDASPSGTANVKSILASLSSNSAALLSAFQVKDPATKDRATAVINLINGEVSAIQTQLATTA